jgi:hypothetical protein
VAGSPPGDEAGVGESFEHLFVSRLKSFEHLL